MSLRYEFDTVKSGEREGINDPVTTTFDTHLPTTVAREAIQNILDARVKKPAIAEFEVETWDTSKIPDVGELKNILKECVNFWPESTDCRSQFESALRTLEDKKIEVLKVSDFNTRGLKGDDEDTGGDYFNFLKSIGSSSKDSGKGGSFGLGKGSFYAASKLKTIFVSSIFDQKKAVFQGKLRLVSHKDLAGNTKRAGGSYGLPEEKPVRDYSLIPRQFRRKEQGTTIFIPGFKSTDSWQIDMVKSVLRNFWYAILKGDLEVRIGEQKINPRNLKSLMYEHFDPCLALQDDSNPLPYYEALSDEEHHKPYEEELPTLGKVKLFLLPHDGFPRRVACFRKNRMLIQTKKIGSPVAYAGMFICEDDKGNEILRKMEPPNHNEWSVNNTHSKADGKPLEEAEKANTELLKFIRSKVKELNEFSEETQLSIPGMSKYLYLPGDEEAENTNAMDENAGQENSKRETPLERGTDGETVSFPVSPRDKAPIIRFRTTGSIGPGEWTGIGDGDQPGGGKKRKGKGPRISGKGGVSGTPADDDKELRRIESMKFRAFAQKDRKGNIEHVIILHGDPKSQCRVRVLAGTDDGFDTVEVKDARTEKGKVLLMKEGFLSDISLDRNGDAKLILRFGDEEKYSLRALAYEN